MKQKKHLATSVKYVLVFAVLLNIIVLSLPYINRSLFKIACDLPAELYDSNRMYDVQEFKYLISKPECNRNGTVPYFIILIHSSPTKFAHRAASRETWAHSDPRTKTYFLMGTVQSQSLQKKIDDEEATYNDIIQGNFVDSYHNLTYKHTMALKWFSENCPHVKYLFKIDDDVFVNIPGTYGYLRSNEKDTKFLMGPYRAPEEVHREGKWNVKREEFIDNNFPEFVVGSTVIYSNDYTRDAYKQTRTTRFFWVDDVFITGLIRMQLNVRIEPIYPFMLGGEELKTILNGTTNKIPKPSFLCSDQSLKPQDIRRLWECTKTYRQDHQYDAVAFN